MPRLVIEIDTERLPRAYTDAATAEEHARLLERLAELGPEFQDFAAAASAIYVRAIDQAQEGFIL